MPFRTCIRKNVFDKVGLFDEGLAVGEDYDMMRRFILQGLKIHHLKESEIKIKCFEIILYSWLKKSGRCSENLM